MVFLCFECFGVIVRQLCDLFIGKVDFWRKVRYSSLFSGILVPVVFQEYQVQCKYSALNWLRCQVRKCTGLVCVSVRAVS